MRKGFEKGLLKGMEKGRLEGREEGILEGIEKGREEGILITARKLKAMGVPAHSIAEATGLSAEVIEGI